MKPIKMEREGREVLAILTQHGYSAFFVGGYVRDLMMRRNVKDIDIATSAQPDDVIRLFPRTIPTGIKHGTVTVKMKHHTFEVTTFRSEAQYEQYRRPKEVTFITDLEEDLRRRDFTMNAMALDQSGQLVDPFDGMKDIKLGILRCVGNPVERFAEDALRMMRCIRFAAEYELDIEENTWQALHRHGTQLQYIAMERIRIELEKIVEGSFPCKGLQLLTESKLLRFLKVDLELPIIQWEESGQAYVFEPLSRLPDGNLRWTLLFLILKMDTRKTKIILHKLTFSRKRMDAVVYLLHFHEWIHSKLEELPDNEVDGRKLKSMWKHGAIQFGKSTLTQWIKLVCVGERFIFDTAKDETNQALSIIVQQGKQWLKEVSVEQVSDLVITGDDLIRLGYAPGPWIGRVLQQLVIEVGLQQLPNTKDALLKKAISYINETSEE